MSSDLKPRIQLRLVTGKVNPPAIVVPPEPIEPEAQPAKKRGRPRKVVEEVPNEGTITSEAQVIKRGRKKKPEMAIGEPAMLSGSVISKSYIVQLKVKSSDLDKVQKHFMDKSQNIGYKPPQTQDSSEALPKTEVNFDEYYKLLNSLEMPLVPVADLAPKMNMVCGQTFKNTLPPMPQVYPYVAIPVKPNRVPIKLFDEDPIASSDNFNSEEPSPSGDCAENRPKAFRNTTNLVLPQFTQNGGQWPKTSPYPCWNCDIYFDGTPVGIIDREVNGKIYAYGNCCDFPCSARYMKDRENPTDFWIKYSILCMLYQKANGLGPESKVPIAWPPEALSKYGGKYSYEEYHSAHKTDRKVEVYKLPLIPVMLHIEEISRTMNITQIIQNNQQSKGHQAPAKAKKNVTERFIPIDPQEYMKANENLRQKTQERIQSNNYSLDNCFRAQSNV